MYIYYIFWYAACLPGLFVLHALSFSFDTHSYICLLWYLARHVSWPECESIWCEAYHSHPVTVDTCISKAVSKTHMSSYIWKLLTLQQWIQIVSFYVWVWYFVWNFKCIPFVIPLKMSRPYIERFVFYSDMNCWERLGLRTPRRFWTLRPVSDMCGHNNVFIFVHNLQLLHTPKRKYHGGKICALGSPNNNFVHAMTKIWPNYVK